MPRTLATSLRSETGALVRLADRDLARLWRLVADGANAEVALRDLLPAIVRDYGQTGAAAAALWYDDVRAKAGVKGRFAAIPVEPSDRGADSLAGWALATATDEASLKTLVAGGVSRRIADHVRETVMTSAVADPGARGWQREGVGTSCSFCNMLIGRGAVYSDATVNFASHDHCNCAAVPAFEGQPRPVQAYTPTTRNVSDAERAALRRYLRENH